MKGFVLVSLEGNKEREFLDYLKKFSFVRRAYILFGEWDVIAELDVDNSDEFGTFVMDKVRGRPGVKLTSSLIVAGR